MIKRFLWSLLLPLMLLSTTALAQDIPDPLPREAVYIPYNADITLDGMVDDWDGIPVITVTTGPAPSRNPSENGAFTFALAADESNLYIHMTSVDATIVTGQHGSNYWNEDSLEIYLNFTGDVFREDYTDGVHQININPGDIGNEDPTALTIIGANSAQANLQGYVFATDEGWGFEAAVPYPDGFVPEHGAEIGVQAHANGSSGGDRDVKLIWSAADTDDLSYLTPSVWGQGVFYEIGRADIPEPSPRPDPVEVVGENRVSVNQVGYAPDAPKFGVLAGGDVFRTTWSIIDADSSEMRDAGLTSAPVEDSASGAMLVIADFSDFTEPGTYRLLVNNVISETFTIGDDFYADLKTDAARYFYLSRSGIELLPEFAGEDYARAAGHISDAAVTCYAGTDADGRAWDGCDYTLDALGGWYDAGDYGKYVVNGGIAAWTLMNLYERLPDAFPDDSLNIPESGDDVPDLLNEIRWQMRFMLGMQVPEGEPLAGMVHHKLHDLDWEAMPSMPELEMPEGRYVYPPSTAATYNLAATAAQCARIWREIDPAFASDCLQAAEAAFTAASENPDLFLGNTPGSGGGNYGDGNIADERFWAAAELYITTGVPAYLDALLASEDDLPTLINPGNTSIMNWQSTASLGALSLLLNRPDLPADFVEALENRVIAAAQTYVQRIEDEGYRVPLNLYFWGSNGALLNNAIVLAYAHDLTGEAAYLDAVSESLDYLLGRNALGLSFITGYGQTAAQNPHHRFWANEPASGYPAPPPGVVVGGPNANREDDAVTALVTADTAPARTYIDNRGSFSTNEVAINWNAPLTWVVAYLDTAYE